jgi:GTP cyclohydrolase III
MRAAATGVATLERIEAAAAKVEHDIAAALEAHAELQAGAGRAAEAAVRAAQEAWTAAGSASESDKRARISLRMVARWTTITMALLFIAIIILIVTATTAH